MIRQGSWIKDFWHGVKLAWHSAWVWQRVYKLEARQTDRWHKFRGTIGVK